MSKGTYAEKVKKMESFKRLINLGLVAVCMALEIAVFAFHWLYQFRFSVVEELQYFRVKGHLLEIAIYAVILFAMSHMYGGMRLGYLKNSEIIFSQIFATLITNVVIYAEVSVMTFKLFVPDAFITMTLEQCAIVIIYIYFANKMYRKLFPPRKLFLVHGDRPVDDILRKFGSRADKYRVEICRGIEQGPEAICDEIMTEYEAGHVNAVALWDITNHERNVIFKFCYSNSIRVYIMPKITDVILVGAEELHVFDSPMLLTREYCLTVEQRLIKRFIDLICSVILLIVTSPFMLLTAIAIKICDGGPILYKQVRCTIDRKEFQILKFRSMKVDAEKDGVARLAQKNDDRITPVGRVIRKCRLDELPQLFNILKGDMSFIGPRPERPDLIEQYMEVMPEFAYRMKVKAGLAGFAQVYGKYNTSPYDKLKLDLTYIEKYSVWLDIKLMMLTLKVLFWPDSTEGVESEQITALKEERIRELEKNEPKKE